MLSQPRTKRIRMRVVRPACVLSKRLLSVATAYLKSLLHLQILPHRELQLFVFDLCAYLGDFALLQQLLHYHVVLDS